MNGFEAFERINEIAKERKKKRPKIIAMTAYAMEEDRKKCLEVGMDAFLSKPFKREEVFKALNEL